MYYICIIIKTSNKMNLINSKENNAKVKALKLIPETKWNGNTIHDNLDKCLIALNLQSCNSGHYNPTAIKINGLNGYFMINEDGSIFCEARIIKEDINKFRIEYLIGNGWTEFENKYIEFLES